jgi:hypothetical protein
MRKIYFIFYQCIQYMFSIPLFNGRILFFNTKKETPCVFLKLFSLASVCEWQTPLCGKILRFLYTVVGSGKAPDCVPVHTRALSAACVPSRRAPVLRAKLYATPSSHPASRLLSVIWDLIAQNGCFFSTSSTELFADDRRPFKEPIKLFLALVFVIFYKDLLEPAT